MSEPRPCPLCRSQQARPHLALGEIRIVRCKDCGLLFRPGSFTDLASLYGEEYYRKKPEHEAQWGGSGDYVADTQRLISTFGEHLAELERFRRPPGRLLDVGCATGALLEAARRLGWDVTGLDISEFAVEFARKTFGVDARAGEVAKTDFAAGSFDVITAFEYIEHVPDPAGALARLRSWLRPEGVLVLTTPNAGSWAARRHPERFDGFLEQRHLAYFTRATMARLLRTAGFAPMHIQTDAAMVTVNTLAAWGVRKPQRWRAFMNRAAPGLKQSLRRAAGRVCGGPAMKVYATPSSA